MPDVFNQMCAVCGAQASRVEVVKPDEVPQGFEEWDESHQASFLRYRRPNSFLVIYNGIGGSSGSNGTEVSPENAQATITAFSNPPTRESVRAADFYDNAGLCLQCNEFYCYTHWNVSNSGYGTCPRNHGASLDPHWSPDD